MQVSVTIPDIHFIGIPLTEVAAELRLATALLRYQAGEISAGAACEIAGIDRYAFHEACHKYKIPILSYGAEELAEELELFA